MKNSQRAAMSLLMLYCAILCCGCKRADAADEAANAAPPARRAKPSPAPVVPVLGIRG
ncbi:hypothetical protein [Noviherbaspirillum galbum]|nr:hypothetical protein [Noviherbaspirillum galbum]